MELESWLDGYDQRKNDLLSWFAEGGEAVAGARELLGELEETVKRIRRKIQADAAAADLARMDDLLGGATTFGQVAPEKTILASAPALEPMAAPPPPPAAPAPVPAAPLPPAAASIPEPVRAEAPPPAATEKPGDAAEGILKSLAWMDSREPEEGPKTRSRTSTRPAAMDMFFQEGAAADARVEAPPAPAPEPARSSLLATESSFRTSSPAAAVAVPPAPPPPAVEAPSPVSAPAPAPAPSPRPALEPYAPPSAAPVVEPPPPAPDAPRRRRKPIVIGCPQGEERRAALADVGPGPDMPYLLHAVVEIPRGGGTGYVYNDEKDVFVVVDHPTADAAAALGHVAFGFVPETVSDDGAHLDTFILSSGAAGPGELLRIRPLGYLRRADGDHKLLSVPEKHPAQSMADIPEPVLRACETWRNPSGVSGGTWCDGEKARELVRRCAS